MIHQYRIAVSLQEINLERTLRSGQTFRWRKDDSGTWQGADGSAWFSLRQTEDSIEVSSNADEPATRSYLDLERSFAEFAAHVAANGPELSPMLSGIQGLRVLNATGTLETVFTFLCSGNNSLHRIIPMAGYLGVKGSLWPNGAYRFPDLDQLLEVTEAELRAAGFGYRAKFIVQSAARMRDRGGRKVALSVTERHLRSSLAGVDVVARHWAQNCRLHLSVRSGASRSGSNRHSPLATTHPALPSRSGRRESHRQPV